MSVPEKLKSFNPAKAPVRVASSNQVSKRVIYLPRFRPYYAVEFGHAELDGGYVWKIPLDVKFADKPAALITVKGYWELPLIHIKVPLPAWVGEVEQDYFTIVTLPIGKYRLIYFVAGPV